MTSTSLTRFEVIKNHFKSITQSEPAHHIIEHILFRRIETHQLFLYFDILENFQEHSLRKQRLHRSSFEEFNRTPWWEWMYKNMACARVIEVSANVKVR